MKKKLFAALLAFVMVLALVPATALAADKDGKTPENAITTVDELKTALGGDDKAEVSGSTVKLKAAVSDLDPLYISVDPLTLDLNGQNITMKSGKTLVFVGGTVTITDSSVTDATKPTATITQAAGTSKFATVQVGRNVEDNSCSMTIEKVKIDSTGVSAVLVAGTSNLNVESGEFGSTAARGINTNGKDTKDTASITINGGTINGPEADCGIYLPNGKLTVNKGTISGGAGIVVRGGTLEVNGGTIEATATGKVTVGDGAEEIDAAAIAVNGKDGASSDYGASEVTITDGEFKAPASGKTVSYAAAAEEEAPVTVSGGNFKVGETADATVNQYVTGDKVVDENGNISELSLEVVDFGYGATRQEAIDRILENRKDITEDQKAEKFKSVIDQTMFVTFKDPIPKDKEITVTITCENDPEHNRLEETIVGDGTSRTYMWSLLNETQTPTLYSIYGWSYSLAINGDEAASTSISSSHDNIVSAKLTDGAKPSSDRLAVYSANNWEKFGAYYYVEIDASLLPETTAPGHGDNHWIGWAVEAPEGAKGYALTSADAPEALTSSLFGEVKPLEAGVVGDKPGLAMYYNADTMKGEEQWYYLTWFSEDSGTFDGSQTTGPKPMGTVIIDAFVNPNITYAIDSSALNGLKPGSSNIQALQDASGIIRTKIYDQYYTQFFDSTHSFTITTTNLKPIAMVTDTTNKIQKVAYWTGLVFTPPTTVQNAVRWEASYSGDLAYATVISGNKNTSTYSAYFGFDQRYMTDDKVNAAGYVTITWYDRNNAVIGQSYTYQIDFNLGLYSPNTYVEYDSMGQQFTPSASYASQVAGYNRPNTAWIKLNRPLDSDGYAVAVFKGNRAIADSYVGGRILPNGATAAAVSFNDASTFIKDFKLEEGTYTIRVYFRPAATLTTTSSFDYTSDFYTLCQFTIDLQKYTLNLNGGTFRYSYANEGVTYDQATQTYSIFAQVGDTDPGIELVRSGYTFNGWDLVGTDKLTARWTQGSSGNPWPGTSGSGSGTGTGNNNNPVTVFPLNTIHGTVTVSSTTAKSGDTVIVYPHPDKGYEVDTLIVQDAYGKYVTVTKSSNGTYFFVNPANLPVTIHVTYKLSDVRPLEDYYDLYEDQWYSDAVDYVLVEGLMQGIGNGLFNPSGVTTRAEVMTILARQAGRNVDGGYPWYAKAVNWAKEARISDGTDPTGNITREQVVTMIWRAMNEPTSTGSYAGYYDASSVSTWASDAMRWAIQVGLVQGSGNYLTPTRTCTRAELAQMLYNYYSK